MVKPFHVVHLSDLHLTAKDESKRTELGVFKPLRGMNNAFRRICFSPDVQTADHIVITGDVTDRGDIEAWRRFWQICHDAKLTGKVTIIPGNHDVCCLAARLPGKRALYRRADIEKAIAGMALGGQCPHFPSVVQPDSRLVIFGMNSNNLGNLNVSTNAMGELGYFQLMGLASKMHLYRHVPIKIVALHHSPNIPSPETARRRNQRPLSALERLGHQIPRDQRRALMLLCVAHRIRLVIHGHLHLAEERRVGGIRIIGAPASTEPISMGPTDVFYHFYGYSIHGQEQRQQVHARLLSASA